MANNSKKLKRGVDSISTLPDVILQHILSFIPTELAITTSLLSRRWRHVWCDLPSLSLEPDKRGRHVRRTLSINECLTRYTAPKIMSFHLRTSFEPNVPHRDKWIEFAMSRNVENLSLGFSSSRYKVNYKFPDFFYMNSSIKKLTLELSFHDKLIPICPVSWTSLKTLSLRSCTLSDVSMAKILSGCPVLESLTLYLCDELGVLDLSKSMRLRKLEIDRNYWVRGPTQIIAPHIHFIRLRNSKLACTLVNAASLNEAKLDIFFNSMNPNFEADILQVMVLKMLDNVQNAEKLTFGANFLQILSLAELRGVPFPMLKIKTLTLETKIFQYVIPGIQRLLQNSPDLENLILRSKDCSTIPGWHLDDYMKSQGLVHWWRPKYGVFWNISCLYVELKYMISFVVFMLKNTKKSAKMALLLDERYLRFKLERLVQKFSHYNNVAIVLKQTLSTNTDEEW